MSDALRITAEEQDQLRLCVEYWRSKADDQAATIARLEADREKLAQWMIANSYATGHGDSIADLLKELEWHIARDRARLEAEIKRAMKVVNAAKVLHDIYVGPETVDVMEREQSALAGLADAVAAWDRVALAAAKDSKE